LTKATFRVTFFRIMAAMLHFCDARMAHASRGFIPKPLLVEVSKA
jgi:hypothetical protein